MKKSMSGHQRPYRGKSDIWLTPPWIIKSLAPFGLDPCAAPEPRPWDTACEHWTERGLEREWSGVVWLNPPFGPEAGKWLAKLADHGNGIALVAARTETRWFVSQIWKRASAILFLDQRPHFHYPDGTRAPANSGVPIVLVAYGEQCVKRLEKLDAGAFVKTWNI